MNCNAPPHDNECLIPEKKVEEEPSKWESTWAALVGPDDTSTTDVDERGLFRTLTDTQELSVGLITFPVDDRCAILERGELTTAIAALDGAQVEALGLGLAITPQGETPLAGAAIRGLDILRDGLVSGKLEGNSYLVLMTDGVETCQESALEDLKTYVSVALVGFNIHTFVIGAPGSEGSRSLLSELAFLGGTAPNTACDHGSEAATAGDCHLDLTESDDFSGDLAEVFSEIAASTQVRCDFDVPQDAFVAPDKVNIVFTPTEGSEVTFVRDDRDCETEADGWQYTSEAKEKVVLCGDACEQVRAPSGGRVRVFFGCRETILR
jgi:hypothetical protein